MTTYADSSALIPLYVSERFSESADAALRDAVWIPFTVLHRLEILNAFERLVGRNLMTREECDAVERQLRDDVGTHRLIATSIDLDDVFDHAVELSSRYAARHLVGSLDLLHVAAAHASNCAKFVSADDRQLAVARASGLKVVDIKRRVRPKR